MADSIKTKTSRAKLTARREPYFEAIRKGVFVGFRKLESGAGTWIGRYRLADGKQTFKSFGDDLAEFDDARKAVEKWAEALDGGVQNKSTTVSDACEAYVKKLLVDNSPASSKDADYRFKRLVYGHRFGTLDLSKLRAFEVEGWRNGQLDADDPDDEESYNRAKDSANRNLASLKAALNYALKCQLTATDTGWKGVNKFPKVGARREGLLTVTQRRALLEAMPIEMRALSTALLMTGARPGEVANANASDYDRNTGRLWLDGKTGRREVPLSTAARGFFDEQSKDKIGNAPLLTNAFASRWTAAQWGKAFREARDAASLPDAVLYCMRHTYISEAIAQGIDVFTVAKLTGTSVAIIQSNYGALTDNIVERLDRVAVM
ncbi:tyrosine-type recombinase/integrase [Paraburkholderia aromaticivorans]|uniref:tyrosine-type recombinase/integrase n=1 Tax=Paraburkholderia aromaticivorans TaxID=2026199 RepID=UPI001456272F|nr:tyrosine-type recombinase/integrase [Paraburkholderia aromaticivorans]